MTFFQNPFHEEFRGSWVLGDRSQSLTFKCDRNYGRSAELVVSFADGPFNLSGSDFDGNPSEILHIRYSIHEPFDRWALISVDVSASAVSSSAVSHAEIVTALNADSNFSAWFSASQLSSPGHHTQIRSRRPSTELHFYIVNGCAEALLRFNAKAGVSEMPSYFDRHKVRHLFTDNVIAESFPDRMNQLIPLDSAAAGGTSIVDENIIHNALNAQGVNLGLAADVVKSDYELLEGRSGLFTFQKITVDGSDRITQIIEYHAGAKAGDLARKITYAYTGANSNPNKITEVPYTLATGDLVTP